MTWKAEENKELRGYTVEWAEPGSYFLSKRNKIFHSSYLRLPFTDIATIDAPAWKSFAANFRIAQRLLRFMVTNVLPLDNGELFVTFDKSVGIIRDGKYRNLDGMDRPCRVLRSACAVGPDGGVYFGEYLANDGRGPMRIYRYSPGTHSIETVHTFGEGEIKHVHGIYRDSYSHDLYCLTGDRPNECRISRSNDGFSTFTTVGEGDETWRAVSLVFTEEAFYYGTDAEFRSNEIYRVDRVTGERQSLGEVNGTVFYSRKVGDDLFFATTAENAPAQKENVAALWCVSPEGKLEEVIRFPKDMWHGTLFQFGTIAMPNGPGEDHELLFSLVALKGDNRTFRLFK